MKTRLAFMFCLAALAGTAHTQNAAPAAAETWQDQQRQQARATAQIAASPRRHEWVEIAHGGRKLRAFVTYRVALALGAG